MELRKKKTTSIGSGCKRGKKGRRKSGAIHTLLIISEQKYQRD